MSVDNEACQIDAEVALHDVMDIICKYVHGKDLLNMAKVCKSWNFASLREDQKRYHIQQLRLLYKISKPTSTLQPYWINNMASVVHTKPCLSLFIYEPRFGKSSIGFPCSLLEELEKQQLPNKVIVTTVNEYRTTEDIQFQGISIKGHCHLKRGNRDILGIFFPSGKPEIRIHVTSIEYEWLESDLINRDALLAKHLVQNLGLNECEYPKSTVLLITRYAEQCRAPNDDTIIREFGKRIQQSGKEVTLANIYTMIMASRCNYTKDYDESLCKPYMALRISGRTVESWNTFIHYRARRYEIKSKLQALKEKVNKSKRYYIGLVWMPICSEQRCSHIEHPCGNSRMMMHSLKRIFPYIRFTGFFIHYTKLHINPFAHHRVPDVFHENDCYNPDFLDHMYLYVSIIIISYD